MAKKKMEVVRSSALTVREAAARLGVGERTLWTRISAGDLTVVRIGRRVVRVTEKDLERFIDRCRA